MKNIVSIIIIPRLIPLALRRVDYKPIGANRNLLIYVLGGLIVPFIGIKMIDLVAMFF